MSLAGLVDYESSDDESQDRDEVKDDTGSAKLPDKDTVIKDILPSTDSTKDSQIDKPPTHLYYEKPKSCNTVTELLKHPGVSGSSSQSTHISDKPKNTCRYDQDEDEHELTINTTNRHDSSNSESLKEDILKILMTHGLKHTPLNPKEYHETLRQKFGEELSIGDSLDLLPSSDNIFTHMATLRPKLDVSYRVKEDIREKRNQDLNEYIQDGKEFRNPSIYEKLIESCKIDEFGTNYSKEYYDPYGWPKESYYDSHIYRQIDDKYRRRHKTASRSEIVPIVKSSKGSVLLDTNPHPVVVAQRLSEFNTTIVGKRKKTKWDVEEISTSKSQSVSSLGHERLSSNK